MNTRFLLRTFGCKSNQYESQGIREFLAAAGHSEVFRPGDADILILNTCGVTGRAGASCRNAMRKAVRANPALRVIVTGCGVDLDEKWPDPASGAPLLVPNAKKHAIPALIANWLAADAAAVDAADNRFGLGISSFHGHTRAFIKVQDGCDNHCAYCAVPKARGAPQSRPPRDILEEAERLVAGGHGELVLTGINIGVYRHGSLGFPELVGAIAETPGLIRLRLGSVEPPQLDGRLVEVMRSHPKICPHVHLPLQSGDNGILAAMGRRYGSAEFLEKIDLLKSCLRTPAITTDVIVGFPGEDEAAFERSAEVCRRAGFSRLHVFLFSPRAGTPAAAMRRNVPDRVVEGWKTRLIEGGTALAEAYAASCVGLEERVIVEKSEKGAAGLSDRYVTVRLGEWSGPPGSVERVKICAAAGSELFGERLL